RLVGAFVELHIEQGRGLADLDRPIALCSGIWPHGRWRLTVDGEANHAGTTRLGDRRDPMLVLAEAVTQARRQAQAVDGVATVGRVRVAPNASNAIAERVDVWLDARAPDGGRLDGLVDGWKRAAHATAVKHGCRATLVPESRSAAVQFDAGLRERLSRTLAHGSDPLPELPTAAGHDAGVLADHVPAAMLLVRNPTGVSHSCDERAETDDCVAGVRALADTLETLACG
nr:M20/M25/M40 family metallo-hydrolase [Euzebyales bacterium]